MDSSAFATHTHSTLQEIAINALAQELGDSVPETDDAWTASLYHDLAETTAIKEYLEESGEYLDGRWVSMPGSPKLGSDICEPLCRLINSILQKFQVSSSGAVREAVDIHATPFKRGSADSTGLFASPHIVVKALGSSFSTPKGVPLGFSNVSACFLVKLDAELDNVLDDLAQTTAFTRQIFIHQPNRIFVRSLVVTERHARLFHFDRSGAQYTPLINIHGDVEQFIRLMLGLCTTNERTLGFDDSVQWTTSAEGKKVKGTLKTVGPDDTVVTYDLVMNELPFVRTGIRGRGTICWPVKNASGDRFIVKDHWITGSRTPEYELLEEAKGLAGVCQMVSYEDNRAQTKDFRGKTPALGSDTSFNRRAIRIVMKAYGPSIEKFSCVEDVLGALRDAIAAHRALLSRNIVHRDISPNNILHGSHDAEEGDRGILIDLDIAFKCHQLVAENRADFKTGTRMFQSLMVLRTWKMKQNEISAQDYLDDLESFFWVFSYLLFMYKADGNRTPDNSMRKEVLSWHREPYIAHAYKDKFLYSPGIDVDAMEDMDEGWRHACMDLFFEFRDYMAKIAREKNKLLWRKCSEPKVESVLPSKFSTLLEDIDGHYDHVLGLFSVALNRAKEGKKTAHSQEKGISAPQSTSNTTSASIDSPPTAAVASKDSAVPPSQIAPPSLRSDQSTPATPYDPLKTLRSKRRSEEAELDESPADVKRACPPSRRSLRAVVDPTLQVFSSVYQYCIHWF